LRFEEKAAKTCSHTKNEQPWICKDGYAKLDMQGSICEDGIARAYRVIRQGRRREEDAFGSTPSESTIH
jgi:hypothetical protein